MLAIDFKNAVNNVDANNFTCLLFRLLLKSDAENTAKLSMVYPTEVNMVYLFKNDCNYKDSNKTIVDWELLEIRARSKDDDNDIDKYCKSSIKCG